ncbi:MAG: glycosyltransferase family 4 protein [Magnetococcales bacterium]|nr:glycosyltransferase family 4 protein [Magnetococcales bacterium]
MKILYYSPNPFLNITDSAGYSTHIVEMITAFEKMGHTVTVIIAGGTTPRKVEAVKNNRLKQLLKKIVPSLIWSSLKDIRLIFLDKKLQKILEKEIKKIEPDLIYERGSYLQLSGIKGAIKSGTRHIREINSPFLEEKVKFEGNSLLLGFAHAKEKKYAAFPSLNVVVSKGLREYLGDIYQLPVNKICITSNAVNPDKISIDKIKSQALRQKMHLNGCTIIGFVGSIFSHHSVERLLYAFYDLLALNNDKKLRVLIVGNGESLCQLKLLAVELGISEAVIFTGSVAHKDIYNYIDIMDICVLPGSNWYGSPVKIFEYGLLAKAIVAVNTKPVVDVMDCGIHGLICQPTKESFSKAIKKLIDNPILAKEMGDKFQKKVLNEYTWQHMAKKVMRAYIDSHSNLATANEI